ncbi:MAG: M15 family metallopeptidase [Rhizobium sp.]|nr:M15 family metallopeptidase [Rhizobium sp.]MDM8015799.1 M15 family metallopeptidase [Rhizobium sp.]
MMLLKLLSKTSEAKATTVPAHKRPQARLAANTLPNPLESEPLPATPGGFAAELRAMQNKAFCESERYQGQQNRADRVGALPILLELERKVVKRFKKLGIPMFSVYVMRSRAEQAELFARKKTKAKPGESPHQYGLAFDIIHGVKGYELTDRQWLLVKHIVFETAQSLGVKLRWGGDWDGDGNIYDNQLFDPAHFEIANWREIGTKR